MVRKRFQPIERSNHQKRSSIKYKNASAIFLIKQVIQFCITILSADIPTCIHSQSKLFLFLKLRMLQNVSIMGEEKRN